MAIPKPSTKSVISRSDSATLADLYCRRSNLTDVARRNPSFSSRGPGFWPRPALPVVRRHYLVCGRSPGSYQPSLILTHVMAANPPSRSPLRRAKEGRRRRVGAARGVLRDPALPRWRASAGTPPDRADVPHPRGAGRFLPPAAPARRLRCPAPRRNALLTGGKNRPKAPLR